MARPRTKQRGAAELSPAVAEGPEGGAAEGGEGVAGDRKGGGGTGGVGRSPSAGDAEAVAGSGPGSIPPNGEPVGGEGVRPRGRRPAHGRAARRFRREAAGSPPPPRGRPRSRPGPGPPREHRAAPRFRTRGGLCSFRGSEGRRAAFRRRRRRGGGGDARARETLFEVGRGASSNAERDEWRYFGRGEDGGAKQFGVMPGHEGAASGGFGVMPRRPGADERGPGPGAAETGEKGPKKAPRIKKRRLRIRAPGPPLAAPRVSAVVVLRLRPLAVMMILLPAALKLPAGLRRFLPPRRRRRGGPPGCYRWLWICPSTLLRFSSASASASGVTARCTAVCGAARRLR